VNPKLLDDPASSARAHSTRHVKVCLKTRAPTARDVRSRRGCRAVRA
jgi:hypothetical protein